MNGYKKYVNTIIGDNMKILITGATSGIGYLTGLTLASRGHKIIMTTHNLKQLEYLNNKLKSFDFEIETFKLDLLDKEDLKLIDKYDIDVLINHAGVGIGGSLLDLDIEEIKNNFEVNFFSSFDLAKRFCNKLLKQNKKGKLIITSSIAGSIPFEFLGSYCSSKSAITMMARCLRKELNIIDSNIDVSVIEPGAYKTGFNQVMIDKIYSSIDNNSVFYNQKENIYSTVKLKFSIMEKKSLESIVCQIIRAVEDKNNKFIYSAPLSAKIMKKLYLCFFG